MAQGQERRKDDRISLERPPRGRLELAVGDSLLPVNGVVDVSPQGVGVMVDEPLPVSTRVEVCYRNTTINLRLPGITVWAAAREPAPGHMVGVELLGPSLLHTFL